jgi:hypothetical protein
MGSKERGKRWSEEVRLVSALGPFTRHPLNTPCDDVSPFNLTQQAQPQNVLYS